MSSRATTEEVVIRERLELHFKAQGDQRLGSFSVRGWIESTLLWDGWGWGVWDLMSIMHYGLGMILHR